MHAFFNDDLVYAVQRGVPLGGRYHRKDPTSSVLEWEGCRTKGAIERKARDGRPAEEGRAQVIDAAARRRRGEQARGHQKVRHGGHAVTGNRI